MTEKMREIVERALSDKAKRRWRRGARSVVGCVVALATLYSLILPALTFAKDTVCGMEEHTHDASCYITETVPGEMELACDKASIGVHVHTEDCYDTNHKTVCGYADYVVHTHTDACYADGVLVCPLDELKAHTHTDGCYTEVTTLTCEQEEAEGVHTHTEECYTTTRELTCLKPEIILHTHTDDCFETLEDEAKILACTQTEVREHIHGENCFREKQVQVLTCGMAEHIHTDDCYDTETTPPTEETTAPTEETTVPTEETTVPTEETTAPTEGTTAPTEDTTVPVEESDAPAKGLTTPAEKLVLGISKTNAAALMSADTVVASGTTGDLAWTLTGDSGNYTLTISGTGIMPDYSYNGMPWYNYRSNIKTVVIKDGVTGIGNYAFGYCSSLTSVTIPGSVTSIGDWAFHDCSSLTSVTIPEGVTSIGNWAFYYCTSLALLTIPEGVTSIGNSAFSGCSSLTSMTIPDSVTSIGDNAFNYCSSLTSVDLPTRWITIGNSAFYGCSGLAPLDTLASGTYYIDGNDVVYGKVKTTAYVAYCPAGAEPVAEIPKEYGTGTYAVTDQVAKGVSGDIMWELISEHGSHTLRISGVGAMPDYSYNGMPWYSYRSSIKTVVIEDGVTSIGSYAFAYCSSLTSVTIPDSVISISNVAFGSCSSLTSVTIPNSVTSIGDVAFSGCSSLTSVTIPEGVTSIGNSAFSECSSLISVTIPDSVTSIGDYAFGGCGSLTTVDLPTGWVAFGNNAFYGCSGLAPLDALPSGTYYIDGNDVVYGKAETTAYVVYCPAGMESAAEIPNEDATGTYAVTDLVAKGVSGDITWELTSENGSHTLRISGVGAMQDYSYDSVPWCNYHSSIKTVVIEDGVTSIGNLAFYYCTKLTAVTIPEGVTSIGNDAFQECTSLTSVTIPDSVTSIGDGAFSGCTSLTSVPIPDSVINIGNGMFGGCRSLISVTIPEGVTSIGEYSFSGCSSLTSVTIPDSVTSIGGYAFNYCTSLTSVTIPDSVTGIGNYAFNYCTSLTSVTIPDSVTSIGEGAFSGCSSLTSVTIPDSVTSIGGYAFNYCTSLTSVTIPDSVTSIGSYAFQNCSSLTTVDLPTGWVTFESGVFCNSGLGAMNNLKNCLYYIDTNDVIYAAAGNSNACVVFCPEGISPAEQIPNIENTGFYHIRSDSTYVESGKTGDLTWTVTGTSGNYTLLIGGTGGMPNYSYYVNATPWYSYRSGIQTVVIEDGVTSIGDYAFYNCSSLISVDLPTGWVTIGSSAFSGCSGIAPLNTLPSGTYYVDSNNVVYVKADTVAYVAYCPAGVESAAEIPNEDGTDTYAVTDFVTGGVDDNITWTVTGIKGIFTLTISGTGAMPDYTSNSMPWYNYRGSINIVKIEDGVTSIGCNAFNNCSSLTSVDLPTGWIAIGDSAFSGCSKLAPLNTLPGGTYYADGNDVIYGKEDTTAYVAYCPAGAEPAAEIPNEDETGTYAVTDLVAKGVSGDVTWELTGGNGYYALRISGTGAMANYLYTYDAPWYSYRSGIQTVVIEDGVTSIGNSAFSDCSRLTSVTIPDSVTSIGNSAFSSCSGLTSVKIGDGVTSIGNSAFSSCSRLVSVEIGNGVTSIGNSAFSDCSRLTSVTIPDKVTSIGDYAFGGCGSLTSVEIGNSVASIGGYAFYYCGSLTKVTIPDSVTSIGYNAFCGCSRLTTVNMGEGAISIGGSAFGGCSRLTTVNMGAGVTSIGERAFSGCSRLTSVTIPDSVTSIGSYAFQNCSSLKTVSLPVGWVAYGSSVFNGCNGSALLSKLNNSYYYVDTNDVIYAIVDSSNACVVFCPEGVSPAKQVPNTEKTGFYKVQSDLPYVAGGKIGDLLWSVTGDTDHYTLTFSGSGPMPNYHYSDSSPWYSYHSGIKTIMIEDGVTSIGEGAFGGCSSLTSVTIPDSVTSIGNYAFSGCSSLPSVSIPDRVTSIGDSAFYNCSSLISVTIPEGVTSISGYAFRGCSSLTSVMIPYGVTSIGNYAFYECSNLKTVSLSSGWISIGSNAFYGCTGVASLSILNNCKCYVDANGVIYILGADSKAYVVYRPATETDILAAIPDQEGNADVYPVVTDATYVAGGPTGNLLWIITEANGKRTLTISGKGAMPDYNSSSMPWYNYRSSLSEVIIEDGVTSISNYAFQYCSNLTSVEIGEGVTSIGNYAFRNCSRLTSITLNAKALSSVDSTTFSGDKNIKQIIIGEGVDTLYPVLFSRVKSAVGSAPEVSFTGSNYLVLDSTFTDTSLLGSMDSKLRAGGTYFVDENGALYLIVGNEAFYIYSPMSQYVPPQYIPTEKNDGSVYKVYSTKIPAKVGYINDLVWIVFQSGEACDLVIAGSGAIPNYSTTTRIPWYGYRDSTISIHLREGITGIGVYAFRDSTKITEVELPASLTNFDASAFRGCTSLYSIIVAEGNPSYRGVRGILYDADLTTLIYCPQGKDSVIEIPETVTAIGNCAFSYNTVLTNVDLPGGIVTIGNDAFYNCSSLTSVTIPDGVTGIGNHTFYNCSSLTSVTIPDSVTIIGSSAFENCSSLTSVTIPDSVTSIGSYAFRDCSSLTSVTIPDSVTSIGSWAFYNCSSLTSITLNAKALSSVSSGYYGAFSGDKNIQQVIVGESVDTLYPGLFSEVKSAVGSAPEVSFAGPNYFTLDGTFTNTSLLGNVGSRVKTGYSYYADEDGALYLVLSGEAYCIYSPDANYTPSATIPTEEDNGSVYTVYSTKQPVDAGYVNDLVWIVYKEGDGNELVIIGAGAIPNYTSYSYAPWYSYRDSIKTITIEDGVTGIGDYTFYNCSNLTTVSIPEGVTSIGSYAFAYCSSLTSVTIPQGVTYIGWYAFRNCSSLTSVTIPEGVTIINSYAFYNCSSLTSVTIPDSVTSIGDSTFRNCSSLTSVTIPDSVTSIGRNAFSNCSSLTSITLNAKALSSVGYMAFDGDKNIRQVVVGAGVDTLYPGLFSAVKSATGSAPQISFSGPNYFLLDSTFTSTGLLGSVGSKLKAGWTYFADENDALYLIFEGEAYCIYSPMSQYIPPQYIPAEEGDGSVYRVYTPKLPETMGYVGGLVWIVYKNGEVYDLVIVGSGDIPDYITSNAPWYSYRKDIASIHLGEGVTGIGAYAFQDCAKVTEVEIPASVTDLDALAFKGCTGLNSISVADGNPSYQGIRGILYDADLTTLIYCPQGKDSATELPETVTAIGDYAFGYNGVLTNVDFPSGLTSIGEGAFYECDGLQELALPEALTTIGDYAFYSCDSLTSVDIPGSVTGIGASAFRNCKNLTRINAQGGYITLGADAFTGTACYSSLKFSGPGLHYMDAEGGLYWINDGKAYYIGCPKSAMDYYPLSKTPRIGELGPYWVDNEAKLLDYGATGDLYWYIVEEFGKKILVINGEGTMPDYTSSSMPWYNYRSSLSEVVIGDGVANVGSNAFYNFSSLTSVTFPDSVTSIGGYAFYGCSKLTSVTIPEGVTSIGDFAFYNCSSLTSVDLPTGWVTFGDGVFWGCSRLAPVDELQGGTYYIDANGVIYAKSGSGAYVVYCPANVDPMKEIPNEDNTDVYPVIQAGGQTGNLWWTITEKDGICTLTIGGSGAMPNYSVYDNTPWYSYRNIIEAVVIEDGVTSIGNEAFCDCRSLTSATIPDSVTIIGSSAFEDCGSLTSVTIPDSVTIIGSSAFEDCGSLTSVTIPEGVTGIYSDTFENCSSLTTVTIPDSVTSIREYAFSGCSSLTSVTIPQGVTYIGWYAFCDCSSLTSVTIPDSVTSIREYAFSGCSSLTSVTIPDSVTRIGNGAFRDCRSLTSVEIPDSVTSISNEMFSRCSSLTSVTIPEGVTSIGDDAFQNCSGLTSVKIPGSVTYIGFGAFRGCSSLTTVTIPGSVTSIGYDAFQNCSSLTSVEIGEGVTSLGSYVFGSCISLTSITLNAKALSGVDSTAFSGDKNIGEVIIGTGVDTLYPALFKDIKAKTGRNPLVRFQGANLFTVDSTFTDTSLLGDLSSYLVPDGTYYLDEYGALYAIENGEAALLYVPSGVTEYTIPGQLSGEDGGDPIPVTAVYGGALSQAARLESLTFQLPENIKRLADLALANCPTLTQVNGQDTADGAIATFTNPNVEIGRFLFLNTGLSDGTQPTREVIEITAGGGSKLQLLTHPDARDGDYTLYTGQVGRTTIAVNGGNDGFRVYFAFSSPQGAFSMGEGDHKFVSDKTGEVYTVKVEKLDETNVYCLNIPAVAPSDTISFDVTYNYPSPSSSGGTVTIWGEAVAADQTAPAAQGSDEYHSVSWITEPETYTASKRLSGDTMLYSDGTEDGYLSVVDLSYTITLTPDNNRTAPQGFGADPVTDIEYTDILTIPEGMAWKQEILDAVAAGSWSSRSYYVSYANQGYEIYCVVDGQTVTVCRINSTSISSLSLSLTDTGELCIYWRYVSPSTGLQNQSFALQIMDGCLLGKRPSVTELDDSYTLTNTVTAVEHFKYSADQTDTAATTDTILPTEATLTLNKIDQGNNTTYGNYYPYTITMSNYGARHLRYINTVTDVLLTDLYITPADMIQMLQSDPDGEKLTITIENATLYQQLPEGTVTGTDGREYSTTIQNTSLNTEYVDKRLTPEDDAVFVSNGHATLTIGWVEGVLTLQADVSKDASIPTLPFTSIPVEDAASLQTALEQLGYYVTPGAQYTVCWNYKNELPLWSGETRTYQVRSTVKDAFMSLGLDKNWYKTDSYDDLVPNVVAVKYTINGEEKTASASTYNTRRIYNDFYVVTDVYKDGELVDEHTIIEGGGVADFQVYFSHSGTASYDIVPLVDRMRGAEILMVRATENPHLGTEYGLTPQSVGGLDYYLLDTPGTYENVVVGGYLAESVTVSPYGANCLDTMIRWYFTDISGSVSRTLKFKVLMAPVGDYVSSLIFGADNQVWLNDHQTHRLWSGVGIYASYLDFSKDIVLEHMEGTNRRDVLDEDGYTRLYEGNTVTYRLHLRGMLNEASVQAGRTLVVPGKIVFDSLPKSIDGYRWSTANLTGIEYVISDEEDVEVVNRDHWQIVDPEPGTLTDTDVNQQYLDWDDDFCVTFHATGDVYMYITLQFPEGDDWERYADAYGAERLENVYHFGAGIKAVYHDLAEEGTATLAKGVNSTGVFDDIDDPRYYPSSENGSRYFYANDDSQRRVVTYYVALYNEGRTRLYLDDIQDSLPEGFTLCENGFGTAKPVSVGSGHADVADVNGGGVKYLSANISVTQADGKLRFRASGGDLSYDSYYGRYYLLPHEALVFSYRCYTNGKSQADDISENTVAMAYFDYNTGDVEVGGSQITGSSALATQKNDGTCWLLDNGTAGKYGFTTDFADASTQWLSSTVVVQRGEIIPGITKEVSRVMAGIDGSATDLTNFAGYNDFITWKITARNDGTAPIRDYVLTDVMQTDYIFHLDSVDSYDTFDSYLSYTIRFGDRFGNPSELEKSEAIINQDNSREVSKALQNTGSATIVTKAFGTIELKLSETDQGPSLTIRFKDDKAAIPEGGYGVLEVITRSGGTHRNTTYTNTSYITLSQTWEESQVNVGDVVELDGKKSVQASALITVATSYVTTSVKRVEEKGNPDNFATSDSSRNAIVIPDGEKPFTYTLSVTNTSSLDSQTMDRLVLIDSLPGQGDHSVLLDTDLRFSQFRVDLAETPNFRVTIVDKDGNETPLVVGTDYRLEFSDKTSFTTEDWAGQQNTEWYSVPTEDTRSFRVVITEAEHNRLIAAKATVTVSFDARIHPEDLTSGEALPGETAWNSFGYQYGLTGSTIVLSAAPLKVGVKLPSVPVLVKRIQTPEGSTFPTEQDETFRYVIYKQSGTDVLDLDGLTEAQIGEALTLANVKFTCVELTVASGETESEMRILKDQNRWSYTGGQWTENTEEPWDWEDGASYIFYELPIKNAEDYAFGSLGGVRRNSFRYVHDAYNKYTVISVNVRRVWNISLLKVADNDKQSVLAGAWFGLYSPNAEDRYTGQIPEGLTEAVPESLEYGENTYYLADIRQSGADGTILWKDLEELRYVLRELQPPAGYHYSEELYLLERPEEVYFNTVDITVKNRSGYEMPESGGIGTGLYTTMGMILTLTAGAALIVSRRRRKREET